MIARNVFVLGSIAIASFMLGCGAPPDGVGKDGKGVGGSPNDPGWVPPGANNGPSSDDGNPQPGDDQGEQPGGGNPNGCKATPATTPDGFTSYDMGLFTVAAPSSWNAAKHFPDPTNARTTISFSVSGPAAGSYYADAGVNPSTTSLDMQKKFWNDELMGKGGHGVQGCTFEITDTTYQCDPAAHLHVLCVTPNNTKVSESEAIAVLHGGVVYGTSCEAVGSSDFSTCTTMNATLRVE